MTWSSTTKTTVEAADPGAVAMVWADQIKEARQIAEDLRCELRRTMGTDAPPVPFPWEPMPEPPMSRDQALLAKLRRLRDEYFEVRDSDEEDTRIRRFKVEVYGKIEELEEEFASQCGDSLIYDQFMKEFMELHHVLVESFGMSAEPEYEPRHAKS